MKRISMISKYAVVAVAVAALVGCGSDSTTGGSGTTDAGSSSGADGGSSSGGGTDAGTAGSSSGGDAGSGSGGAADAGDPCDKCADNEICKDGKCEPKPPPPCNGKCPTGEICDVTADNGKGKCIKPTCAMPAKWHAETNKVSKIEIPSKADGACDLNDDGKPDNALGKALSGFAKQIKDGVDSGIADGSLTIVLEPSDWKTDGSKIDMNVLIGDLDPSQVGSDGKPTCDTTKDKCKYVVSNASYDQFFSGKGQCPAVVNFNPTTITKGKLKAGGDKQVFLLKFPVLNFVLEFKISSASMSGDVSDDKNWKSTKNAKLCGVLKKKAIEDAIDKIPEEELKKQSLTKDMVKQLVTSLLKADIDQDEDGTKESVSVYIKMETIPAEVTGIKK